MLESARALVLLLFLNYVQEVLIARPILKPCPLSLTRTQSPVSRDAEHRLDSQSYLPDTILASCSLGQLDSPNRSEFLYPEPEGTSHCGQVAGSSKQLVNCLLTLLRLRKMVNKPSHGAPQTVEAQVAVRTPFALEGHRVARHGGPAIT